MDLTQTPVNRLDLILEDYLVQRTNYALLLTATWGAGKTYYLKNHFFQRIDHTGYKPVLVSLFGIRSIDDIKDRIFAELYPILENKHLKMTTTAIKVLAKSLDITKLLGNGLISDMVDNIDQGFKEVKKIQKENLVLDKLLVCFDDLERVNPALLSSSEILGYINSLVEDDNIKVIIVANEGKIDPDKFLEVKEKTIGHTIHFNQDFNDVFLNVLEKGNQPVVYRDFLKANQQLIADSLAVDENYEKGKVNYRTLSYFISSFSQIFQFIDKGLAIKDLDDQKGVLLTNLIKFSLFVCNEYKKGFFSFLDRKGFDDPTSLMMQRYLEASTKDLEIKSGRMMYVAQAYYGNEEFNFYESIYDYLTGGDFFDKDRLIKELKLEYHVVDENISAAYKVYNKLANVNYKNLSDREFRELTRQMKNFALSGDYDLKDYLSVLYYVLRLGNVLNLNPDRLTKQLLTQIRRKVKSHVYNPVIGRYTEVSKEAEFYHWSIQLRDQILKVNHKAGILDRTKVVAQIEHDLVYDYEGLYNRLIKAAQTPFVKTSFSGVNANKFFSVFQKGDNQKKSSMETLFRVIYMPRHGNHSVGDLKFLRGLESAINRSGKALNGKNISPSLYKELLKAVQETITEVLSYQPIHVD